MVAAATPPCAVSLLRKWTTTTVRNVASGREISLEVQVSGYAGRVVLEVDDLKYGLPGRSLLTGIRLRVAAGESVAVTGTSGSGKTTLLTCILGLIKPDAGAVRIGGVDQGGLSPRARARHRRENVGMVFQFGELLPELSPLENVALAGLLAGMRTGDAYTRAAGLLDELGVRLEDSSTATLSGGERQRTAVARALMNDPALLLADEPTGSLDPVHRDAVAELLYSVPRRRGCALLVVTHDTDVAQRADRQVRLDGGRLSAGVPETGEVA